MVACTHARIMHFSRRAARTPLVLLASAALTASVAVGITAPAAAFTPEVKPRSTTIAAGSGFTLAIVGNKQIYATGTNSDGQLPGQAVGAVLTTLTQINALPDATWPSALAAGTGHSVALAENGKVYAVGYNNTGQLANGTTGTASPATWAEVTGLPLGAFPVQQVAASGLNTYVLGANGEVYGAGWNDSHQISAASTSTFNTMTLIDVPGTVTAIAAGGLSSGFDGFLVARNSGGFVLGRGDNSSGQLNQAAGADVTTTTLFPQSSGNAAVIAAGGASSYIVTTGNSVLAVGKNAKGQLGNSSTTTTSSLATMTAPTGGFVPVSLAAGDEHVLVIGANGVVYGAGESGAGAVASGNIATDALVLVPMEEGGGVTIGTAVEVAAGGGTSILRAEDGLVLGSGNGFQGQLTGVAGNKTAVIQLTGQLLLNYVKPTITSPVKVGQVATATPGSWSVRPTTFAYQWFNGATPIAGATLSTYTISPDDLGDAVSVQVTGTRTGFTAASFASLPVTPTEGTFVAGAAPVVSGTAAVGRVLSVTNGGWSPAPTSFTYAWRRGVTPIPGATTSSYELQPADLGQSISALVTPLKAGYASQTAVSNAVVPIAGTFAIDRDPVLSGTPEVGQQLVIDEGLWTPAASYSDYQWYRDDLEIPGATGDTYTLQPADLNKRIDAFFTGSAPGYEPLRIQTDTVSPVAGRFSSVSAPVIGGTATVGTTLTAQSATSTPTADSFVYEWLRDGAVVSGGLSRVLTVDDAGRSISVRVTAVRAGYTNLSAASGPVVVALHNLKKPTIKGTAKVGKTLKIGSKGSWAPSPASYSYRWLRNGKVISKATKTSYKLTTKDKGKRITVRVTARKPGVPSASAVSAKTSKVK